MARQGLEPDTENWGGGVGVGGKDHLLQPHLQNLGQQYTFQIHSVKTVHSKMEGDTKRSVYHPDRVPAFSQNTLFISCPSFAPHSSNNYSS